MLASSKGRFMRGTLMAMTLSLAAPVAVPAAAQESASAYPSRQITMIVPFAPGGATDVVARLIGKRLETTWGKAVVIENRPGSGGVIGATAVVRAAADGYTLFLGAGTNMAVNVSLYKKLSLNDVAAGHVPLMMVDIGPALGTIQAGGVRALGISTAERFPTIKDVPPIGETVPGFDASGWFMFAGPGGLPQDIAQKLHTELDRFLREPDTAEQIVKAGLLPQKNRPLAELHKFVVDEIERWRDVVRKAGVEGTF